MLKRLGLALGISLVTASATTAIFAGNTLRVLSYNVQNLWDDIPENTPQAWSDFLATLNSDDRDEVGGRRPLQYMEYTLKGSNWYTLPVLEAKIQNLIEVIQMADTPEILALQELESAANESHVFEIRGTHSVLKEELEKLGYRYFILGHQNPRNPVSVTTAIVSKVPVKELDSVSIDYDDEPYSTSARDIQAVEYNEGGNRMVIFNNHWKSKIGDPKKTEATRVQTAQLLRQRIQEEKHTDPNTRIVVLGDLNSGYHEKPIKVLATGEETEMLREEGASHLYNLWYDLENEDRWETSYRGRRQSLSAMLISDDFYNQDGIQYKDQSFRVIGQSGEAADKLLNADGTPFRWQIRKNRRYANHIGQGFSDHLPLIASFEVSAPTKKHSKRRLTHPVRENFATNPQPVLDQVPLCSPEETVDIKTVDLRSNRWFRKCVRIEGSFRLDAEHPYAPSYIHLGPGLDLTIAMTRSWDELPNIDDSRVKEYELDGMDQEDFGPNGHPRSNRCFGQKMLRGRGGRLSKAVGRLGYFEGRMAIYVPTRESKDLILSNLPIYKTQACRWDNSF